VRACAADGPLVVQGHDDAVGIQRQPDVQRRAVHIDRGALEEFRDLRIRFLAEHREADEPPNDTGERFRHLRLRGDELRLDGDLAGDIRDHDRELFRVLQDIGAPASVSFVSRNEYLVGGYSDGTIIIWDTFTWEKKIADNVHSGSVNSVVDNPTQGDVFASASDDGRIYTWSPEYGDVRSFFPSGHSGSVNALAFSNDGNYMASGSNDASIIIWDFRSDNQGGDIIKMRTINDHPSFVLSLAFSGGGGVLASGGYQDNTIMLHDPFTGTRVGTLYGNADDIVSLAFSPNGYVLASASNNETIILWDTKTWEKLRSFSPGSVVAFSPSGQYLISGTKDGRIILWDVKTGDQIQTVETGSDEIFSLDFPQVLLGGILDRNTLAVGSADGTIQIWSLNFSR